MRLWLTYVAWLKTNEECKSKSKDEEYVDGHCLKIVNKYQFGRLHYVWYQAIHFPKKFMSKLKSNIFSGIHQTSGVTGGGQGGHSAPQRLLTGKFLLTYREKRGKEKRERGENWVEKVENWKWKQENVRKRGEDLFFFFFFFFSFHFWKRRKFVLGLPKWNFLPGKSISRREKNQEKWLCPLRKICLLRPASNRYLP